MNGPVRAGPRRIAHRCGGWLGPENTLAGCVAALQAGRRAFECDVKLSADGVPFLLHDDDLDRTTTARGRASARSWAELAEVDAGRRFEPGCGDVRIPALAELEALLRGRDAWLNLEIKPDVDADAALQYDWGERIAAAAARLWRDAGQPPLLSSFSTAALRAAARAAPELPRAWLCEALPADWQAHARELGVVALHLDAARCQPEQARAVRAAGLALRLYTVNDAAAASAWLQHGVDGLFIDHPDLLRAAWPRPEHPEHPEHHG